VRHPSTGSLHNRSGARKGRSRRMETAPIALSRHRTQAAAHQARRPKASAALPLVSWPITAVEIAHQHRVGVGPRPSEDVVGALHAGQPNRGMASLGGVLEGWPCRLSPAAPWLPAGSMRENVEGEPGGACPRAHGRHAFQPKRAQTVAVAHAVWPAPVSAKNRFLRHTQGQQGLAKRVVDSCAAPVWLRSCALSQSAAASGAW